MSHQDSYYKNNKAYAQVLNNWDPRFYAKYVDTLTVSGDRPKVLDVGCGVGKVVQQLNKAGVEAYGVDVSEPNIKLAKKISNQCQIYNGKTLPFEDKCFDAAGALNVLEHVDEPENFIHELVRVVRPGGRVVLSSPNFFRVFGFRDYHPHMRGISQKWNNWKRLKQKRLQIKKDPQGVKFDRMHLIVRDVFQIDHDAIVATNPIEMQFFLEQAGCVIESVSCTDRYVPWVIDFLLNLLPTRFFMFNAFLIAKVR